MNLTSITRTIVITAMGLMAGCAETPSEAGFGDAVRHMTGQQIHNLDVAYNPDPAPVTGGDPYKLKDVLEAHQNNAEDPTEDTGALATDY